MSHGVDVPVPLAILAEAVMRHVKALVLEATTGRPRSDCVGDSQRQCDRDHKHRPRGVDPVLDIAWEFMFDVLWTAAQRDLVLRACEAAGIVPPGRRNRVIVTPFPLPASLTAIAMAPMGLAARQLRLDNRIVLVDCGHVSTRLSTLIVTQESPEVLRVLGGTIVEGVGGASLDAKFAAVLDKVVASAHAHVGVSISDGGSSAGAASAAGAGREAAATGAGREAGEAAQGSPALLHSKQFTILASAAQTAARSSWSEQSATCLRRTCPLAGPVPHLPQDQMSKQGMH